MQSLEAQKRRRDEELGVMKGRQRKWLKGLGIGLGVTAGLGLLGYGVFKMMIPYSYSVYQQTDTKDDNDKGVEATLVYDKLSLDKDYYRRYTRATLGAIRATYDASYPERRGDEMLVILVAGGKAREIRNRLSIPIISERHFVKVCFGTKEWLQWIREDHGIQ